MLVALAWITPGWAWLGPDGTYRWSRSGSGDADAPPHLWVDVPSDPAAVRLPDPQPSPFFTGMTQSLAGITTRRGLLAEDDFDLDGARVCAGDCDDTDSGSSPFAFEDCDPTTDLNCDGDPQAAAFEALIYQDDQDGDGFGVLPTRNACELPPGATNRPGDCDDADPAINPEASEVPLDGIDQNCAVARTTTATRTGFPTPTSTRWGTIGGIRTPTMTASWTAWSTSTVCLP